MNFATQSVQTETLILRVSVRLPFSLRSVLKKPSENSGRRPSREEKGLGSSAARLMKNARCTGRLDDH